MANKNNSLDLREDERQQEISRELQQAAEENQGSMAIMAGGTALVLVVAIALLFYVLI